MRPASTQKARTLWGASCVILLGSSYVCKGLGRTGLFWPMAFLDIPVDVSYVQMHPCFVGCVELIVRLNYYSDGCCACVYFSHISDWLIVDSTGHPSTQKAVTPKSHGCGVN